MLKRTKSCFVIRMKSYIIGEDQVHHLIILVGMDEGGGSDRNKRRDRKSPHHYEE